MKLYADIEQSNKSIDGWTSIAQANAMASMILALRPSISVEIGVWHGKGLVPMGLAHKAIRHGKVIGIDPYSAERSSAGQVRQIDTDWWAKANHEHAMQRCIHHISSYGLSDYVELVRKSSDEYEPPEGIGLIRVDGNHGPQAIMDVERYAPKCITGAIMFLDDLEWGGGVSVAIAAQRLMNTGWVELCRIDNGMILRKETA